MNKNLSNLIVPRINVNSDSSLSNAINLVNKFHFDSFILFASEEIKFGEKVTFPIERFNFLKKELQKKSETKILFFIDAENGFGHRCDVGKKFDVKDLVSNEKKEIIKKFFEINMELYENQISFNLAPVVDVNIFNQEILKGRSYSNDPEVITRIASLFIDSCYSNKIVPCLKHFPGQGAAIGDTHLKITQSSLSLDELLSTHISPFVNLIDKVELIMLNHVNYLSFDREPIPASMSKKIMNDLLVKKLGYKKVVISDSLRMGALTENFLQENVIESFIRNGGDLILDPVDPKEAIKVVNRIFSQSSELIIKKIKKINNLKAKARSFLKR